MSVEMLRPLTPLMRAVAPIVLQRERERIRGKGEVVIVVV
jgi:hypothetical protein